MAKTLADLRSTPPAEQAVRAERSVRLCLRPDLMARVQELTGALADLPEPEFKRARKMAESEPRQDPEVAEREAALRAELEAVLDEMAEHEGEMLVRANRTDGEWRRWVDAHPPRPEGEPGHDRDMRVTSGLANADALIDDLGTYAHAWNSEPLTEGDWVGLFEPVVPTGDKAEMARAVVTMYEARADFRQWRSALSASLKRFGDSASPETSGSATSGSMGGSPAPSSEATTETATASP